jgi:hypothetical protein
MILPNKFKGSRGVAISVEKVGEFYEEVTRGRSASHHLQVKSCATTHVRAPFPKATVAGGPIQEPPRCPVSLLAGLLSDPDLLARPFARPVDRRCDVVGVRDHVLGRIEFNQIDHIEARAAE